LSNLWNLRNLRTTFVLLKLCNFASISNVNSPKARFLIFKESEPTSKPNFE